VTDSTDRARVVTECPDGPLLVRGLVAVLDEAGNEIPHRRATVALCRCGGSRLAPWCDGTHRLLNRRENGPAAVVAQS
jgi:CDGSH-type Zn-finger protein